jgi:hypothetical protein
MTFGTDLKSPKAAPAKPAAGVSASTSTNGAVPRADATGDHLDNQSEREAVFAHIARYSRPSWRLALWELAHSLAIYTIAWWMHASWFGVALMALMKVRRAG